VISPQHNIKPILRYSIAEEIASGSVPTKVSEIAKLNHLDIMVDASLSLGVHDALLDKECLEVIKLTMNVRDN
jgi:hypothetical protein